jgi:RNA recognition motif-containing protein
MTNRPRGFAFVGYAVKEAAEAAALALNETELDGRTIYARIAEERGKSRPNRISHTSREREWNAEGKDDVRLYVGNLGFDVDENSIRSHFEQYGTITDMYMPLDRETGRGRGFAFVTMPDAEAYRAVSEASFAVIDGREVRINEAQTKTADSGFAGGRRNDRRGNDRNYDRESW